MVTNEADRVADEVAATLKERGFKKRRRTWTRDFSEIVQVFNVQASQWSQDDFYVNVGVYIKDLGDLAAPPENKCHVRRRVPQDEVPAMLEYSLEWLDNRTSISDLCGQTINGDPREMVFAIARDYLQSTSNDR